MLLPPPLADMGRLLQSEDAPSKTAAEKKKRNKKGKRKKEGNLGNKSLPPSSSAAAAPYVDFCTKASAV